MMPNDNKFDARLTVNIGDSEIKAVRGIVILPRHLTDYPKIELYPTENQLKTFRPNVSPVYSIKGNLMGPRRQNLGTVKATEVHSDIIQCSTVKPTVGEPIDLVLTRSLSRPTLGRAKGNALITDNQLLQPAYISWDDEKREIVRQFKFKPDRNISLAFDINVQNWRDPEISAFSELECTYSVKRGTYDQEKILEIIDDVLLLASFAARRKTTCLKFSYEDSNLEVTKFLRDRTFPKRLETGYRRVPLIELREFKSFMAIALRTFNKLPDKEPFRRLLNFTFATTDSTLEADFVMLYAALEMFVGRFRSFNNLDLILTKSKFAKFRDLSSKFLTSLDFAPYLEGPDAPGKKREKEIEHKRNLMKDKLGELNRVSFSEAFRQCVNHFSVDLDDLWPTIGKSPTLSGIRNNIVHGSHFRRDQSAGLIFAREHLRWTLERLILALLKFPVEKTNVSRGYLRYLNPHSAWKVESKYFSGI